MAFFPSSSSTAMRMGNPSFVYFVFARSSTLNIDPEKKSCNTWPTCSPVFGSINGDVADWALILETANTYGAVICKVDFLFLSSAKFFPVLYHERHLCRVKKLKESED